MLRMINRATSKSPPSTQLRLLFVLVIALLIGVYQYTASITTSYTYNPIFVSKYSTYGSEIDLLHSIPKNWKPKSRVVVSFTTMPRDIVNLHEVLVSLGNQTIKPDAIYAIIPYTNKRTGENYIVPDWVSNWHGLTVLRSDQDYGPLTKLVPSILAEKDPNTIIITVDDDKLYVPNTIRHLVWYAEQDASAVWGLCGWAFMWVPLPYGVTPVYIPWSMRSHGGRSVDVLQAVCGVAYRRKFFENITVLAHPHRDCFTTDDMWISGYLATVAKIARYLTPGPFHAHWTLEPDDSNFLKKERINRLSDINKQIGKEWLCIRGVEAQLGFWTTKTAAT